MSEFKASLVLVTAAVVAPTVATAEPLRDADRVHDLHSSDRLTPVTTVGFGLGYEIWDGDTPGDPTILGFDVSAHVVSDAGAGGYVVLPLSYLSYADTVIGPLVIEGESEVALGNIEVGGLYVSPLGRRADLIVHGGLALPTADDDGVGAFQALASVPRYGELAQRIPNATWLRLGVSPMGRGGPVFWRVDVGLDLMLDDGDGMAADISPIFRVNLAGGIDLGKADLSAELVTNITDPEDPDADESASTFTLGVRFQGESVQPGFAIVVPVGFDDLADNLELALAFSLVGHMK